MEEVKRPKKLDTYTYLMGILNLTGYLFITGHEETKTIEYAIVTLIIIFSYWCLYKFQRGYNWARILVIIASVLSIFNLIGIFISDLLVQLILIVEATLGACLLYWLSSEPVKTYFKTRKE